MRGNSNYTSTTTTTSVANPRPRAGIADRGNIVSSASALRTASMPATRNANTANSYSNNLSALSSPYGRQTAAAPMVTTATLASALLRAGSASASRRAVGPLGGNIGSANNNNNNTALSPGTNTNNNTFMSHTISRPSQRSKLMLGNSPLQQGPTTTTANNNNGSSTSPSSSLAAPLSKALMPSIVDTPLSHLRASPSSGMSPSPATNRSLFSPLSPSVYGNNNQTNNNNDSGSSVGSPTPARSEYSLPSPSASPVSININNNNNNNNNKSGGLAPSPFDYNRTSNRFGLSLSPSALAPAPSPFTAPTTPTIVGNRTTGNNFRANHHPHNNHHNHNCLLPALQVKAQNVANETANIAAKFQQQQQQLVQKKTSASSVPRSPSNDELGFDLASAEQQQASGTGGGGIVCPPTTHTIVFDLDETLACNRGPGRAILRPGATDLLRDLAAHRDTLYRTSGGQRLIEIVLWTASMEDVALPVVRRLDPEGSIFDHLIYRDHRWFRNEANYTKDLKLLGRDMAGVCIVENSPVSVRLNRQNAILVKDFLGMSYRDVDLFSVREVLLSWVAAGSAAPIDRYLMSHPLMCSRTNTIKATAGSTHGTAGNGLRYF